MYKSIYGLFSSDDFDTIVNRDMAMRSQGPLAVAGARPSDPSTYSGGLFKRFENDLKDRNVSQEILDLLRNLPTTQKTEPGAFGSTITREALDVNALVLAIGKLQAVNEKTHKLLSAINDKTD
jgi:hypothetical protein